MVLPSLDKRVYRWQNPPFSSTIFPASNFHCDPGFPSQPWQEWHPDTKPEHVTFGSGSALISKWSFRASQTAVPSLQARMRWRFLRGAWDLSLFWIPPKKFKENMILSFKWDWHLRPLSLALKHFDFFSQSPQSLCKNRSKSVSSKLIPSKPLPTNPPGLLCISAPSSTSWIQISLVFSGRVAHQDQGCSTTNRGRSGFASILTVSEDIFVLYLSIPIVFVAGVFGASPEEPTCGTWYWKTSGRSTFQATASSVPSLSLMAWIPTAPLRTKAYREWIPWCNGCWKMDLTLNGTSWWFPSIPWGVRFQARRSWNTRLWQKLQVVVSCTLMNLGWWMITAPDIFWLLWKR